MSPVFQNKNPILAFLTAALLVGCSAMKPSNKEGQVIPPHLGNQDPYHFTDGMKFEIDSLKETPVHQDNRAQNTSPHALHESDSTVKRHTESDLEIQQSKNVEAVNASQVSETNFSLFNHYLPSYIHDRRGWIQDIATAFNALHIPINPKNICAVVAITEQESNFHAEPLVRGLPSIVRKQLQARIEKYNIPEWSLKLALAMKSPGGGTYDQRIDSLKTENDLNHFYRDFTAEFPLGEQLLEKYNPVHTGGPMQVSLTFAEAYIKQANYPYHFNGTLRDELFTRRGGLFFGIAYLLDYKVSYDMMLYRFADFNAGRYASRNAAFQKIVAGLSHKRLNLDGDLLIYNGNEPSSTESETLKALLLLSSKIGLQRKEIVQDLQHEKTYVFESTRLYQKITELAAVSIQIFKQEEMPEIQLKSPKIIHKLTTEGFAMRVNERYRNCLHN